MTSIGGWLTPAGHSGSDPQQQVEHSIEEHGWVVEAALAAFTSRDPLHCYYGEDCNPDEYLGYAERFVKMLRQMDVSVDVMRTIDGRSLTSLDVIREIVRRTFSPSQLVLGWIKEADIEGIAVSLVDSGIKMSAETKEEQSSSG